MVNTGVLVDASGRVDIKQSHAGKADDQRVQIKLEHLEPYANYDLVATVGESNVVEVVEFTANQEGHAKIDLRSKEKKEKSEPGEVRAGLPAELSPITSIENLAIVDAAGQTILTSDLNGLHKLHVVFKRSLENGEVQGKLYVHAHAKKAKVKLHASGLTPETEYSLALNGGVAGTAISNPKGKLVLHVELVNPLDVLSLETIELLDADGNVLLSTTLP